MRGMFYMRSGGERPITMSPVVAFLHRSAKISVQMKLKVID